MDEKQAVIVKRVLKKLSALRATLSDEERAILDTLINVEVDVEAHAMIDKANIDAAQTAAQTAVQTAAMDVSAHAMIDKANIDAAQTAAQTAAMDVSAHAMIGRVVTNKVIFKVVFDDKNEVYKLID